MRVLQCVAVMRVKGISRCTPVMSHRSPDAAQRTNDIRFVVCNHASYYFLPVSAGINNFVSLLSHHEDSFYDAFLNVCCVNDRIMENYVRH